MTTIFVVITVVLLIFNVFQWAEIHAKNELLTGCVERLNASRANETQLEVNVSLLLNRNAVLRSALIEIKDCNDNPPYFMTWAKRTVADALWFLEKVKTI